MCYYKSSAPEIYNYTYSVHSNLVYIHNYAFSSWEMKSEPSKLSQYAHLLNLKKLAKGLVPACISLDIKANVLDHSTTTAE